MKCVPSLDSKHAPFSASLVFVNNFTSHTHNFSTFSPSPSNQLQVPRIFRRGSIPYKNEWRQGLRRGILAICVSLIPVAILCQAIPPWILSSQLRVCRAGSAGWEDGGVKGSEDSYAGERFRPLDRVDVPGTKFNAPQSSGRDVAVDFSGLGQEVWLSTLFFSSASR